MDRVRLRLNWGFPSRLKTHLSGTEVVVVGGSEVVEIGGSVVVVVGGSGSGSCESTQ